MIKIVSMADTLKDAKQLVRQYNDERNEHLIKCYFYPDNESFFHWCKEIANFPRNLRPLKSTGKLPTYDKVWEWAWGCDVDNVVGVVGSAIKWIEDDYPPIPDYSFNEIDSYLNRFYEWYAQTLSTDRAGINGRDVESKLRELLRK